MGKRKHVNKTSTDSSETSSKYFRETLEKTTDGKNSTTKVPNEAAQALSSARLDSVFYNKSCEDLAKALLGKHLVRHHDGERLCGKIVETEAYLGGDDLASHSKGNKQSARNKAMFMSPGTAYVYHIYGMYCCVNVSSKGEGAAVLIRSLEPNSGLEPMRTLRQAAQKSPDKQIKDHHLCNGPSKLCQAFNITKTLFDQKDLVKDDEIWIEDGENIDDVEIVTCSRIGLKNPTFGRWSTEPLRYYIMNNKYVSVIDKKVEGNVVK